MTATLPNGACETEAPTSGPMITVWAAVGRVTRLLVVTRAGTQPHHKLTIAGLVDALG